jgi:hypothetical protein
MFARGEKYLTSPAGSIATMCPNVRFLGKARYAVTRKHRKIQQAAIHRFMSSTSVTSRARAAKERFYQQLDLSSSTA